VSLLRILERHCLLDADTLARLRVLQVEKGYLPEEALGALGPEHAGAKVRAAALLEREGRRRLNIAGILRVFAELHRYPGRAGVLLLLSAASALFSFPFIFSWYLGAVLQHLRYSRDVPGLWALTSVAGTVLLANTLLEFLLNTWASRCNFHLTHGLVGRCWEGLLRMPYPLYQRQDQGELMGKLTHVVDVLQKHQLHVLKNLLHALCMLLAMAVSLLHFHFALILLFAPTVLLTYVVPMVISHRATPFLQEEPARMARVTRFLQVAFASHWLLRFKGLANAARRLDRIAGEHWSNQSRKWLTWNLGYNSKVMFNLLTFLTVLWGGGALFYAGAIRLEELVSAYVLIAMVTPRLDELYRIYVSGQTLHANYASLDELLEAHQEPAPAPAAEEDGPGLRPALGAITSLRLEGVSFRYRPGGSEVLRDVTLELRHGERYVLRGESGAGKSTLVDLLLGLLAPDAGRLLVNQQPLAKGALPGFWRRVSLHDQNDFAFLDRSAEENIRPPQGEPAPGADWWRLANSLGMPLWGAKRPTELSGGERQRLCLLRTLARKADLYIFDEPTSALDSANAALIIDFILSLQDAVVLVISHDPDIIRRFDHVISVDRGWVRTESAAALAQEQRA